MTDLFTPPVAIAFGNWLLNNCTIEAGQWRCNALFLSDTEEAYKIFKAQTLNEKEKWI